MNGDYAILPLAGCIGILLFVFFVLAYRPKTLANLLFIMFCLTVAIWLFGTYKMFIVATDSEIIFWDRFVYVGVTLMTVFLYHFGVVYMKLLRFSRIQNIIVALGYIIGLLFLVLSQTNSGFINGVFRYKWGAHTVAGPLHSIFLVFFLSYWIGFLAQIIKFCKQCRGIAKSQLSCVLGGFVFLLIVGPFAYLPAYEIPVHPLVFVAVIPFVLLLFHAMVKYEFLSEFDELLIGSAIREK